MLARTTHSKDRACGHPVQTAPALATLSLSLATTAATATATRGMSQRSRPPPACRCSPTYGAAGWQLPPVARPPPAADTAMRAALFGRALCAGHVLRALKPLAEPLTPRARAMSDAAVVDRAALALRSRLEGGGVLSRSALCGRLRSEPRFLLREIAALLPPERRQALLDAWPKLLLQAERAGAA